MKFDRTIRKGTIATATETRTGDIGIVDGRIAAVADVLPAGAEDLDASGLLVLPGGIDSHCHVEQISSNSVMTADDFYSATVSAAFGGTTTIVPFAAQHRGMSLPKVVADYHACAGPTAVIDYAFHLIVSDPDEQALGRDLPALIEQGYTSFKVYMTYDMLKLDDYQILEVLDLARRAGALVMVHAENNDMIKWIAKRLLANGHTAPKFHAVSHDPLAESEATGRVMADRAGPGLRLRRVRQHSPHRARVETRRLRLGFSGLCRRLRRIDDLVRLVGRRRLVEHVSGSQIRRPMGQPGLAGGAGLCRRILRDAGGGRLAPGQAALGPPPLRPSSLDRRWSDSGRNVIQVSY